MTPRQLAHLKAAVRSIMHASELMEAHVAKGGPETALYSQVIKDAQVTVDEIKIVLDLEEISRGPAKKWLP